MGAEVSSIAHVIQLSVAPVFLLTGVAAMLGVLSGRLARAVDRVRSLESRIAETAGDVRDGLRRELGVQAHRIRVIYLAMGLCALCALLICSVIVTLFISAFMEASVAVLIAAQFVAAMLSFIGALLAFLREVHLATTQLRVGQSADSRTPD